MMRKLFLNARWEANRVLEAIDKADDFCMQEIAQVNMDHFTEARVVSLEMQHVVLLPSLGWARVWRLLKPMYLLEKVQSAIMNIKKVSRCTKRI
jgi:hypothetical protein